MKLDSHVFTLWIIIWILCIQKQECCRYGPGPNCGFRCRCTEANECDLDTGECRKGSVCQSVLPYGFGWEGPGCRIGNVAYSNTKVEQSGAYLHYTADLAVDGDTTPYITNSQNESCAHPFASSPSYAWWSVDLEDIFTIQSITIVNRLALPGVQHNSGFQARSTNYDIKIGNTSDRTQQTLCFHQGKPANQVQPNETMTCNIGDMTGRYVSFTRTNTNGAHIATICEFIVMGYRAIECHPEDCTGDCDSVIGCDQCVAGKKLPDCFDDCPAGYWGVNCDNTCGMCKDGIVCDKVTGSCGSQCEPWYIPQLCADELKVPPETLQVTVSDITSGSATISWSRSDSVDLYTQTYFHCIVQYRTTNSDLNDWYTSNRVPLSNETSYQYQLSDLEHNTQYLVHIRQYREMNGLLELGSIKATQFTTLCIGPNTPPTLSTHGAPDRFTVIWKDLESISPGCDRLDSAAVKITCENSTHTILNETYDILISTNAFTYETTNAISCSVVLSVTNNAGFSSASAMTSVTTDATTSPERATQQQVKHSGPNIAAIIVGASAGVILVILVVVIFVIALRKRWSMPPPSGTETDTDIVRKPNPVYRNTMNSDNDDMEPNTNPPAVYASLEDTNRASATVSQPMAQSGLYENTKGPEIQYASLDDKDTTKPSPVYQELQ